MYNETLPLKKPSITKSIQSFLTINKTIPNRQNLFDQRMTQKAQIQILNHNQNNDTITEYFLQYNFFPHQKNKPKNTIKNKKNKSKSNLKYTNITTNQQNTHNINLPYKKKKTQTMNQVITIIQNDEIQENHELNKHQHQNIINNNQISTFKREKQGTQLKENQTYQKDQIKQALKRKLKLPHINADSKESVLTREEQKRQQMLIKFIHHSINSARSNSQHIQNNNQTQRSTLNHPQYQINRSRTIDYSHRPIMSTRDRSSQLVLPSLNKYSTIQQDNPNPKCNKKTIKLSGVTFKPILKTKQNELINSKKQINTYRSQKVNLLPTQLIYNNPKSDVQKNVYLQLIKRVQSSY